MDKNTHQQGQSRTVTCQYCTGSYLPKDMVEYMGHGTICRKCYHEIRDREKAVGGVKKVLHPYHQDNVKKAVGEMSTKKNCKHCYGRGYIGTNDQGLVISCQKCVDQDRAIGWFKEYVRANSDLHEMFPWALAGAEASEELRVKSEELADAEATDADAEALAKHRDAETQRPKEVHEGEE